MWLDALGHVVSEYIKGVIILDQQGEIVWRNSAYKEMLENEDILGEKFEDVFPVKLAALARGTQILENVSGRKYALKAKALNVDGADYTLVTVEEITDLTNKDIKLYCLEHIIDNINDGVLISDYDGHIMLYNKSQEQLEGLSARDIVGKHLWESYHYMPEFSEHRRVYQTRSAITDQYSAHAYKDGIPKYVSYSTFPVVKDGEVIAVYSISRNENRLQSLLHETLELKRKVYGEASGAESESQNNGTRYHFSDIQGESRELSGLIKDAETMALLDSPVLITGETGTGKEVFAQSIHNYGKNKDEPFVDINCSAIPDNLLESILFGTVKGSYTGAVNQAGLFEEARSGTLFLDEINSMPVTMQTKMLRVLQEKKVRRVGSLESVQIKCRIISAMNEDPEKLVKDGKLRQDLYYRLAGVSLHIPPLRARKPDILHIALFFINRYNKILNKSIKSLSNELQGLFLGYCWPGNIRELGHIIENIMIRTADGQREVGVQDVPDYIRNIILGNSTIEKPINQTRSLTQSMRTLEREMILQSLASNQWNFSRAAKDLGIIRQSLDYRMKKLKIEKP